MKIRAPELRPNPINEEHDRLGLPPVEEAVANLQPHPFVRAAAGFTMLTLVATTLYLFGRLFLPDNWQGGLASIADTLSGASFWWAVAVGLVAQVVDGALGMAYGVTATTFLLGTGASPMAATASVHIAEIFTTGFSGIAHVKFGNVYKPLFVRLLVPGILGAAAGAVVVTQLDGALLKPFVSAYLLAIGIYILSKVFRKLSLTYTQAPKHVGKLALFGGFVDSVGGGGWGPVVTTSLLGSGNDPRTTIGSVNFAEFFLALANALFFVVLADTLAWPTIAGLVVGGIFAAPFAALLCRRLQAKTLLLIVGVLISALSVYNLYRALW